MTRLSSFIALTSIAALGGCQSCSDCLDYSSPLDTGAPPIVYEGDATGMYAGDAEFYEERGEPSQGLPPQRLLPGERMMPTPNLGSGARGY